MILSPPGVGYHRGKHICLGSVAELIGLTSAIQLLYWAPGGKIQIMLPSKVNPQPLVRMDTVPAVVLLLRAIIPALGGCSEHVTVVGYMTLYCVCTRIPAILDHENGTAKIESAKTLYPVLYDYSLFLEGILLGKN